MRRTTDLGMYISMLRARSQLPTCSFAHISTGLLVLQMVIIIMMLTLTLMISYQ